MKKLVKFLTRMILVVILVTLLGAGCGFAYIDNRMQRDGTNYTTTVTNVILDLIPEEGITINGRNYGYWNVVTFLDEVRYAPYNYVHKDHHCILAQLPEQQIHWIISGLRVVLGCEQAA